MYCRVGDTMTKASLNDSESLWIYSFFFFNVFFLFLVVLGLRCCMLAFSSCGEQGLLFVAVRGLIAVASLVADHGL